MEGFIVSFFNLEKLSVKIIRPANFCQPIEGRKYTLTHSDTSAELFLDIGYVYNYEAIDQKVRDEVLAEWQKDNQYCLNLVGKAYVDGGGFSKEVSEVRFNIFMKEMDTALKGIINGNHLLFANYPFLLNAPIYIYYESIYPQYSQIIYYGTPRQYLA